MPWPAAVPFGLVTGLAWLWYIRRKDVREPEPVLMVLVAFVFGCLAALLVLGLRPWFDQVADLVAPRHVALVDAFLLTALPEESAKLLALLPLLLHRETDEPMDGVVYGASVALGFAAIENALCLGVTGALDTALQRSFTATLAHLGFTGCLGFCLATARFVRRGPRRLLCIAGPVAAITLHGTYDLMLGNQDGLAPFGLLIVLPVTLVILSLQVRWALGPKAPNAWR